MKIFMMSVVLLVAFVCQLQAQELSQISPDPKPPTMVITTRTVYEKIDVTFNGVAVQDTDWNKLEGPTTTESPASSVTVESSEATVIDSSLNVTTKKVVNGKIILSDSGTFLVFDGPPPAYKTVIVKTPVGDHANLTELAASLATLVDDRSHAINYLKNLRSVTFDGDLESAQMAIGQARINASHGGFSGPWYKFFQPLDDELSKAETVEQYEAMWKAVIEGLASYVEGGETQTQTSDYGLERPYIAPPMIYGRDDGPHVNDCDCVR